MPAMSLDDAQLLQTGDGGQLAYYETGAGERCVLWAHGLPLDSRSWAAQRRFFDARQRNVFIDLRGYGASSKLTADVVSVTDLYVSDIMALIEHLGLEGPDLVGFASAGHVALRLAAQHPDAIRRLAVLNASPRFRRSDDWPLGFDDESLSQFVDAAADGGVDGLTDVVLDRDLVFADVDDARAEELRAWFSEMSRNAGAQTLLGFFTDIANDDDRGLLGRVQAPTLLMASTIGQEVPATVSLELRNQLPDARLAELPGADHFAFATRPELFNHLLLSFLDA